MRHAIAADIECSECHQGYGESLVHRLEGTGEYACFHCSECCTGCARFFPSGTEPKHITFIDRLPWCKTCAREMLDEMYVEWKADKRTMCRECGSYPIEPTRPGEWYSDLCGICLGIGGNAEAIREAEEWLSSQSLPLEQGQERGCGPVPPPAMQGHTRAISSGERAGLPFGAASVIQVPGPQLSEVECPF